MKYDPLERKCFVSKRLRVAARKLSRWWWWLWTGKPSQKAMRKKLQEDARRFGGKIIWNRRKR
jgi:hypothetical protein